MNYGPLIFLAAFFALASSWFGFVLTPAVQVGWLQQTNTLVVAAPYPVGRPGLARQGLDVYRANGCAYCHSQQLGQMRTVCDVTLVEAGTNQAALVEALLKVTRETAEPQAITPGLRNLPRALLETEVKGFPLGLPKTVLKGVTRENADAAIKTLNASGAKSSLEIVPVGPDIARGWGKRRSVAEDFLYDYPVMLGSQRIGPDLAGVGARWPDANWHLLHLYAPGNTVKGSTMPPYRFLFEKRRIESARSSEALDLPEALAPGSRYEIVPKPEARALAAYLVSLRADAPLFDAPLTVPAPATTTNAPAAPGATSTNAAATNTATK